MRILVIEDDKDVASFIRSGLVQAGCNVDNAANGKDGLFLATTEKYDALVVDRMLPGVDGLTVIRTLRASANTTPVLILSALGEVDDRVKGLKAGGDDYLVKPFAFSELLARLEALVRRVKSSGDSPSTVLRAADLEMDLLRREVRRGGQLDRSAAARVSAARIPAAPRGPSRHAYDAARRRVGLSLRSTD